MVFWCDYLHASWTLLSEAPGFEYDNTKSPLTLPGDRNSVYRRKSISSHKHFITYATFLSEPGVYGGQSGS